VRYRILNFENLDEPIGTAVLLLPLNRPVRVAEDVAVLDNIANGRFILSVAAG